MLNSLSLKNINKFHVIYQKPLNFLEKYKNGDLNIKIGRIDHKYEENMVWINSKIKID